MGIGTISVNPKSAINLIQRQRQRAKQGLNRNDLGCEAGVLGDAHA